VDYGDVENPDSADGRRRLTAAIERIDPRCELQIFLGGDNAVTALAMADVARHDLAEWGLITLDAHLDVRDGHSNGSPVRELVECGLAGSRVVQVGIADYANSASYARWAIGVGLTSISRSDVHEQGVRACLERAVQIAGDGGRPIYVDVDLDVVDRSAAPACPGAVPGGLSADELRRAVRYLAAVPTVRAVDFTEVVDEWDTPDQRTVRLVAVAVLDAIAGLGARP
jgi:formiminoglutamase